MTKGRGDREAEFLGVPFSLIVPNQKLGLSKLHCFRQTDSLLDCRWIALSAGPYRGPAV